MGNVCEHGGHPAPEGKRFCSPECSDCDLGVRDCKWCAWEANPPDLGLAISVHAPWAWALMHGGKDVENRGPKFPRRRSGKEVLGRVWIHASMWPNSKEGESAFYDEIVRVQALCGKRLYGCEFETYRNIRGHIVGSIEVYGYAASSESPWYVPGSLAILVRDPRPLTKPVPAKGALGWWRPEESILAACRGGAP